MATYVLVHGGGHGGWCYQPVARLLRTAGHQVYSPSLTGLGEREHLFRCGVDLDCHITDIVNLLHFEDLRDVILVGHSYGGMVITGAADRATDRVGHLVYLDAATPVNGQALVEVAPEILRLANEPALARIPQSHLCTTLYMRWRDVVDLRQKANGRLWDLDTGHDIMITEPGWVADKLMLLALAAADAH